MSAILFCHVLSCMCCDWPHKRRTGEGTISLTATETSESCHKRQFTNCLRQDWQQPSMLTVSASIGLWLEQVICSWQVLGEHIPFIPSGCAEYTNKPTGRILLEPLTLRFSVWTQDASRSGKSSKKLDVVKRYPAFVTFGDDSLKTFIQAWGGRIRSP